MALTKCPECKNKISTEAEICPRCGFPIGVVKQQYYLRQQQTKKKDIVAPYYKILIPTAILVILLFCVLNLYTGITSAKKERADKITMQESEYAPDIEDTEETEHSEYYKKGQEFGKKVNDFLNNDSSDSAGNEAEEKGREFADKLNHIWESQ